MVVAALLAFGSHALPQYVLHVVLSSSRYPAETWGAANIFYFSALVYGLLLAVSSPKRSGLRVGAIRKAWKGVLLVCGGPIVVTLIVYPLLPTKPWGGASYHMWLTSPLAQDAVFIGYLFGCFDELFPKRFLPKIPVPTALLLTCVFFTAWHVPSFLSLPVGYTLFQLVYVFVICLITGLSRVWTGSILYFTVTHGIVNLIAWLLSPVANAA